MQTTLNRTATVVPKTHAPAAATPAVITLPAASGTRHVVDKVFGSYSAAPTGGSLTIALTVLGSAVSFLVAITAAGPFNFDFFAPLQGDDNTAITITLASGAGTVVGVVNALTR
jgi:hypothetical protein